MSEYSNGRRELDGLFELAASFVGSASRLGLQILSAPLVFLPVASRRRVRRAMAEVARAVVALPRELTDVSVRVVDEIFTGEPTRPNLNLPNPERVGERARAFSERLSRAADEFGTSMGRAADRAADEVERAAARVDEWVETAPKTPKA
jgi:hypothetical protein